MRTVDLDSNASTRVAPEVLEAMAPYWELLYANPASHHGPARSVASDIDRARGQVADLLGAGLDEIVFTSGGSESNSLAIRGALEALGAERDTLVTTAVEHSAVRVLCRHLAARHGYRLIELPVHGDGSLDLAALDAALSPRVALVSAMWANNETGVVFPVAEIAARAHQVGALVHTDAVQAAGKLTIDLARVPVDLLSISGHKLHGPKGSGALFVRQGVEIVPQILGGKQEGGRRAGTHNVPAIVGLGEAAALARARLATDVPRIRELRDRLEAGLLALGAPVRINGRHRLPNTLNASFPDVEGEALVALLDDNGIAASTGAACSAGGTEPSHVLRAMGLSFAEARGALRLSLSRETTAADIAYTLDILPAALEHLRGAPAAEPRVLGHPTTEALGIFV